MFSLLLPLLFFGLAQSYPIIGDTVSDGQIVAIHGDIYELSSGEYDEGIIGVVSNNPAVLLDIPDLPNKQAVLESGVAVVTVSIANGPIASGDFITSSAVPGIGMKATSPGYVLGNALQAYDAEDFGQIEVSINPHLAITGFANTEAESANIADSLRQLAELGFVGAIDRPSTALRYLVATLVVLASFAFGFFIFGRIATNGISAMGRNPLAKRSISIVVIFNVSITLAVIGSGLVLGYFILVF